MYLTSQDIAKLPVADLLHQFVADPDTGWSMGAFGALGEFSRAADEPVDIERKPHSLHISTSKGALRLNLPEQLQLFAYEMPIGRQDSWLQGVALCLPVKQANMHEREAITELGPDQHAMSTDHSTHTLFDMGLQCPQADFCIRSNDPAVINTLRHYLGQDLFSAAEWLLRQMPVLSPHRVIVSRLGRLEVYQAIPFPEEHTPDGPHTHVLPDLAKLRRTHNANIPIPPGLTPSAILHTAHPGQNTFGHEQPFHKGKHEQFQALLARFGNTALFQLKQAIIAAVEQNQTPDELDIPINTRVARAVVKVTLRQLRGLNYPATALTPWESLYDSQAA